MQSSNQASVGQTEQVPIVTACDPPTSDAEFLDRLGIEVICLLHNPKRTGPIILRRRSDGRLYRWSWSRLFSLCSLCQLAGSRAEDCVSEYGRKPGTWTIKRARWAILRAAIKRIWDARELRESGLLTDEEMQSLGVVDRKNEGWL